MIRGLKLCLLSAALAGAIPAAGQSLLPGEVRVGSRPYAPASPYTLRVETDLVEVGVVVRDGRGRSIAGLKARDFQVFDQGRERPVASLSVETLASPGGTGTAARRGLPDAPDARPRPAALTNKTSPTQALLPPQLDMSRQMVKGLAERTWQQVRIVSQDTLESIDRVVNDLARMPGSRMLLLVSSGFLAGTLAREQDQVINRALRTGVVINALDAKGLYAEAPVRPLDEPLNGEMGVPDSTFRFEVSSSLDRLWAVTGAMANFAQSTGGLFFHNGRRRRSGRSRNRCLPLSEGSRSR
jgi:hypothetical protein